MTKSMANLVFGFTIEYKNKTIEFFVWCLNVGVIPVVEHSSLWDRHRFCPVPERSSVRAMHSDCAPYQEKLFRIMFWWFNAEVTPVLIPNTEVKLGSADDTLTGKVGSRQNIALNKTNFSLVLGTRKLSPIVPMTPY